MEEQVKSVTVDRVEFLSDKSLFKGKVYLPSDLEQCKGIVIFTHGLGYSYRQYKISGEYFAENNYLMLTYNLRGHAGTPGEWTLNNSVEDLIEGIDFLTRNYNFPNNDRICVIGHSTGALITLLAALKDKRIKFGSVVTTVTCLRDSYLHWFKSGFNQEVKDFFRSKGEVPEIIDRFTSDMTMLDKYVKNEIPKTELEVPHRYGLLKSSNFDSFFSEIANSPDILDFASKIQIPLLLFRGEYDEVMDVQKTKDLYDHLDKNVSSKFYITDSQNHFHNDKWEMIQSETMKFFDEFCDFERKKADISNKDILIIDDEELVIKTLQNVMRKSGFENTYTAMSGQEALEKIEELSREKNKSFDMIISDMRMPGLDGIETIKRIRQMTNDGNQKQSSVIFMTGFEGKKTQEEAKAVGYVDYLYKPLDLEQFLMSVRKYLQ